MKDKCYAIICDSIGSMKLSKEGWNLLNEKLLLSKKILTNHYANHLCSEVVLSSGDGIEMLFTDIVNCTESFFLLSSIMFPFKMRCGIGEGNISKQSVSTTNVDCPEAYFKARAALNQAKQDGKMFYYFSNSYSDDSNSTSLINSSFVLLDDLTDRQRNFYNLFSFLCPVSLVSKPSFLKPAILQKFLDLSSKELGFKKQTDKQNLTKVISELKKRDIEIIEDRLRFPAFINNLAASLCGMTRQNIFKAKKSGNFDIIKTIQTISLDLINAYEYKNR